MPGKQNNTANEHSVQKQSLLVDVVVKKCFYLINWILTILRNRLAEITRDSIA